MFKDITGRKYGKLTAIKHVGFTPLNKYGKRYSIWLCKCDCGNDVERTWDVLNRGKSSCGCNQKERLEKMAGINTTHNMSHTRLYRIYKGMIGRCYYPCFDRYNAYGGRGITICDEWKTDRTKFFEWALKNGYEEMLTIERIDVNGNYEPSNCTWITMKEQYKNKQSNTKYIPAPYRADDTTGKVKEDAE